MAGKLPNGSRLFTGNWGIEFTWHTIGRLLAADRSPLSLTALELMAAAHKKLLSLSASAVFDQEEDFLLVVEDGALCCEASTYGEITLFVRANSWLPAHMAARCSAVPVPPATDVDDALGAYWLCPPPLRRARPDGRVEVPATMVEALGLA